MRTSLCWEPTRPQCWGSLRHLYKVLKQRCPKIGLTFAVATAQDRDAKGGTAEGGNDGGDRLARRAAQVGAVAETAASNTGAAQNTANHGGSHSAAHHTHQRLRARPRPERRAPSAVARHAGATHAEASAVCCAAQMAEGTTQLTHQHRDAHHRGTMIGAGVKTGV